MKMKINKKVSDILMNILSALILMSGWILYIGASISRDKEAAKMLNDSSRSMMYSLPVINETPQDGIIAREIGDQYIEYIDQLIKENETLTDSLYYYMLFYQLTAGQTGYEYVFEKKKTSNGYEYSGQLKDAVSADKGETGSINPVIIIGGDTIRK